jgi:hypothetical protein
MDFSTTERDNELAQARGLSFLLQLRGRVHAHASAQVRSNSKKKQKNISTISNTSPIRVNCLERGPGGGGQAGAKECCAGQSQRSASLGSACVVGTNSRM